MVMGALEPGHLIIILAIALLVFGPGKVGELGGTLGRGMRDFRSAMEGKPPATPALSARTCTNCHAAMTAEARFCAACGTPVAPSEKVAS
jgi:TatA/E family protein of Tat protein translocase